MRGWRIFFALAALNNLAIGSVMLAGADQAAVRIGVTGPAASYIVGFAGLVIAIFGVGYGLVALNPLRNRDLVVMGALGKAVTVLFTSLHAMAGHIPQNVYLLGMTDLIWALIFCVFLQQTRKAASTAPAPPTGST